MAAPVTPNMIDAQSRLESAMLAQRQAAAMSPNSVGGGIGQALSAVGAALMQRNAQRDYIAAQQQGLDQTANAVAGMWGGMGAGSPPAAAPPQTAPPMASPAPPPNAMGGGFSPQAPSGPDPLMWSDRGPGNRLLMVPNSALQAGEQAFGVTPGTIGAGMDAWFGGGSPPSGVPGMPPMGMGGAPQPTSVPYPTPGYNPQAAGPGSPPPSGAAGAVQMMGQSVSGPPPWNPLSPTPIAQSPSIQGNPAMFSGVPHSEEATQAYNWFAQRWGPVAAAGIVGNLVNESGARLDPAAVHDNGTGLGIAGWRLERRDALLNFAAQNGMDPRSRETQFMFLDHELRTDESPIGERLRNARTAEEAAVIMLDYERPWGWNSRDPTGANGYQNRINAALAYTNEADPRGMNAPIPPEMMAGMEGPGAQFGFSPEAFGATQPGVTMQAPGVPGQWSPATGQLANRFAAGGSLPPTRDISQQVAQPGNINLNNRPVVPNGDGYSTVRSISINEDGREILIPTVSDDGRLLTNEQAIDLYHQTGRHLGMFNSPQEATQYAQQLHGQQAQQYGQQAPQPPPMAPPQPMAAQHPAPQMAPQQPPQGAGGMLANMPPVQQGDQYAHIPVQTRQAIDQMLRNPATYEMGMDLLRDALASKPPERWEPFEMEGGGIAQRNGQTGQIQILVQPGERGSIQTIGSDAGNIKAWVSEDGTQIRPIGAPLSKEGGVNVTVGAPMAKPLENTLTQWIEAGEKSRGARDAVDMFDALAQSADTGLWAQMAQRYGPYLEGLGIPVAGLDRLQAMQQITTTLAQQMRPVGSGAVSDYEQRLFQQMVPRLINTPEGNAIISATIRSYADYSEARGNLALQVAGGRMPIEAAMQELEQLPRPTTTFMEYAKSAGLIPQQGQAPGEIAPNVPRAVNPQTGQTLYFRNGAWGP